MIRNEKIGLYEITSVTIIAIITKAFYTSISVVVQLTGTSAWYMTLISCLTSFVFFYFWYLLLKRFPGMDCIKIYENVLGKFLGKIAALLFSIYAIFYAGSNLREFCDMIKSYALNQTPEIVIFISLISVSVLIAYYGLANLSRVCAISLIPILIGIGILLILAYKTYDIHYLQPIQGYGIKKTLLTGVLRSSAYDEFAVILPIAISSMYGLKDFKKAGTISLLVSGGFFSISSLCYICAFDYNLGKENISGLFELSKAIYLNRFFQRIESIFLFIWIIVSILSVSILFYFSLNIYTKIFTIKNHRPLLFSFSFLLLSIAIFPKNSAKLIEQNLMLTKQYSLIVVYIIPVVILIISVIFDKKGENSNEVKS